MHRRLWLLPLIALLAVTVAFGAACGDDDDGNGGPIDELTEQAGNGEPTSEATEPAAEETEPAAETPAGDETPDAGGNGAAGTVDIAAENSTEFTEDELSAPAGTITIVFENREQGVIHNFALYDSPDSPEDVIDSTELTAGPSTDEITVELEPGEYYYNCQVHPNMEGVLTVE
jgi:plastocyanin